MSISWEKELSRSDAQVKTQGWPVPYIRLTRSNHVEDTQTWFRNTFFAGLPWAPGYFGAPLFLTAFATMAPQVQSEAHGRPTTAGLLHQIW